MLNKQVRVKFESHGREVFVLPGTKILEAAARGGLTLQTLCGGTGTCGKCRVRITAGASEPTQADSGVLTAAELKEGWRLACQTSALADTSVVIPDESLFAGSHQILTETPAEQTEIIRSVRKVYVELTEPTLEDNAPDMLRLEKAIGKFSADLGLMRRLGGLLRKNEFKGTAVMADNHLIDFERGDTTDKCYGLAFDVGTTTVVGALLDLRDGAELAVAADINPQITFGEDVLSRIKHSSDCESCLLELHDAIVGAIVKIIDRMCLQAKVESRHIYEIVFAGNTTMEHLLCGFDPSQLGQLPFVPANARGLMLSANELGFKVHPQARAYVFPVIGGFVGGAVFLLLIFRYILKMLLNVFSVSIYTQMHSCECCCKLGKFIFIINP